MSENKTDTNSETSTGVLRTTRAFALKIEAQEDQGIKSRSIFELEIFEPLSKLRKILREVSVEFNRGSVSTQLIEDDEFGWPRISLIAKIGAVEAGRFVVLAQDRRNGTVIIFKILPLDVAQEFNEDVYLKWNELQRILRANIRDFFEHVSNFITEQVSKETQLAKLHLNLSDVSRASGSSASSEDDLFEPKDLTSASPKDSSDSDDMQIDTTGLFFDE